MLTAYNVSTKLGIQPPGRQDPRLLTAFLTIKNEIDIMDYENRAKK